MFLFFFLIPNLVGGWEYMEANLFTCLLNNHLQMVYYAIPY